MSDSSWQYGNHIITREVSKDKVWALRPTTVVQDKENMHDLDNFIAV
jgi:hypothetical protein